MLRSKQQNNEALKCKTLVSIQYHSCYCFLNIMHVTNWLSRDIVHSYYKAQPHYQNTWSHASACQNGRQKHLDSRVGLRLDICFASSLSYHLNLCKFSTMRFEASETKLYDHVFTEITWLQKHTQTYYYNPPPTRSG